MVPNHYSAYRSRGQRVLEHELNRSEFQLVNVAERTSVRLSQENAGPRLASLAHQSDSDFRR